MDRAFLIPLLTVILPILGAGVGYLIKHNIEKKKDLLSEVTRERRQLYQQFIDLVIDIFSGSKTGKKPDDKELLKKLYSFYKKYILYASPPVINSFSNYFQYLYKANNKSKETNLKTHIKKLSRIMFEMRNDLGLSNEDLGDDGEKMFRALVKDFDEIMK